MEPVEGFDAAVAARFPALRALESERVSRRGRKKREAGNGVERERALPGP